MFRPYPTQLVFHKKTLNTQIEQLSFEQKIIRGKLLIESINNTIKDIEECLADVFNKNPKITYYEKAYRIVFTDMSWANTSMLYGYHVAYKCDFVGFPIQDSNLIWDAGGKSPLNLQELIGDNIDEISTQAEKLIADVSSFISPHSQERDLAAVIVGFKSATIVREFNSLTLLLCLEANARGHKIEAGEDLIGKMLIVGEEELVDEIIYALEAQDYDRLGDLV